jgi:hypothetical protein
MNFVRLEHPAFSLSSCLCRKAVPVSAERSRIEDGAQVCQCVKQIWFHVTGGVG